jgi:hypothetical protein
MNYTIPQIKRTMIKKGYNFFETGSYNLNIIGIRSRNSQSGKFDDALCVIYKDFTGQWKIRQFECTTDPGKHYLMNPLNRKGCIIMVPGQYRKAYKIGIHGRSKPANRRYEALEQIGKIKYVRDNNKDSKLDFDLMNNPENVFSTATAKTNIHRTSKWKKQLKIGYYGAGCQVINDPEDFNLFMSLCHKQVDNGHGKTFTYTLLTEDDID